MAEVTLTTENFKEEVLEHKGLVLVDFWATWCGPCKMLAPVVEEIANEQAGKIKVGKVDVDENMELAQAFRIVSIPTLILFKDGQPAGQIVGYVEKSQIEALWQ